MAGIYIHIPFCKQACHYCDFHFSTNLRTKTDMLAAIHKELVLQKNYLNNAPITSIYLGGGTPSLLTTEEIQALLQHIKDLFPTEALVEVTLEANPDDLSAAKLTALQVLDINRLSIGVQTFNNTLLKTLNRTHNAETALVCLKEAKDAGFTNFNLDLMYAIPGQTLAMLKQDLQLATSLQPTHISAYCLTIEPKTAFGTWVQHGTMQAVDDAVAVDHFKMVVAHLTNNQYDHYEISNFCKPNYHAHHNTNYWNTDQHYLGIGPGAHAYNGTQRQYNFAHNQHYIKNIMNGKIPCTIENLTPKDHINEYLLTSLRTRWGCDLHHMIQKYDHDLLLHHNKYIQQQITQQHMALDGGRLVLTTNGKLFADKIAADLFVS